MTELSWVARAEAAKLRRPLCRSMFAAVTVFVLFAVCLAQFNGQQATEQLTALAAAARCAPGSVGPGAGCSTDDRGQRMLEAMSEESAFAQRAVDTAAVLQTPEGGVLVAADMWATLVGAFAVAVFAGAHVAGEWSGRTLAVSLVAYRRRTAFLAVKVGSLWLLGVAMLMLTAAIFAVAGPVLAFAFPLHGAPVLVDPSPVLAVAHLLRATVVLAAYTALACLCAVVTRSPLGTLLGTVGILLAAIGLSSFGGPELLSPANWISGWMGFSGDDRAPYVWSAASTLDMWTSLAALMSAIAAIGWGATRRVSRMDVTS